MKKLGIILSVIGAIGLLTHCDICCLDQVDVAIVSPSDASIPHEGGTFNLVVSSNEAWTASSSADWVQIPTASGSCGLYQPLNYEVLANTSGQSRTAVISVITASASQNVNVYQAAHPVAAFLSRWYPTNCGTQPYGDSYQFEALPTCPSGYHISTKADFDQLCDCPSVWTTKGPGEVPGRWFCFSEEATANPSLDNGSVFFPAAGIGINLSDVIVFELEQNEGGYYCTNTPHESNPGLWYILVFNANQFIITDFPSQAGEGTGIHMKFQLSVRCIKD